MAIRTVAQLLDELSEYRDDLPVRVSVTAEGGDDTRPLVLGDERLDGEIVVVLYPES